MRHITLFLILCSVCSASSFPRMVKLQAGLIVDHRPIGHKDVTAEWVRIDVSNDSPMTLNALIAHKCGRVQSGKLTIIKKVPLPDPGPSDKEVMLRALENRVTAAELAAARAELIEERKNE